MKMTKRKLRRIIKEALQLRGLAAVLGRRGVRGPAAQDNFESALFTAYHEFEISDPTDLKDFIEEGEGIPVNLPVDAYVEILGLFQAAQRASTRRVFGRQ